MELNTRPLTPERGYLFVIFFIAVNSVCQSNCGITFNIHESLQKASTRTQFSTAESVYLICKSSDHPPSSLSIVKKDSKGKLHTTVIDGTRIVYHFNGLQCAHMGTYVCLLNDDPSQIATVDVPVRNCPPQLCYERHIPRNVYPVNGEVRTDICVISTVPLSIESVFRNRDVRDRVPERSYNTSIFQEPGYKLYYKYYKGNIVLRGIQEKDIGTVLTTKMVTFVNDNTYKYWPTVSSEMVIKRKGITFNIHESPRKASRRTLFSTGQSVYLMCDSSDHTPSSLSIVKKYSDQIPPTKEVDGTLVYHIQSLQCSNMGTYVCMYNNDTSQNSTLDLPMLTCPPQLCQEEIETRTVYAAPSDDASFGICVISQGLFQLDSVSLNGNGTDKLLHKSRYNDSTIIPEPEHSLYYKLNFMLRDIQEQDFGNVSIKLVSTVLRNYVPNYTIVLERKAAPKLCSQENKTRTITADLHTKINFTTCLIARENVTLDKVFLDDQENATIPETHYGFTSENKGDDPHHYVNIEIFDIQEINNIEKLTFRISHISEEDLWLDYQVFLRVNVENDVTVVIENTTANYSESWLNISSTPIITPPQNQSGNMQEQAEEESSLTIVYVVSGCLAVAVLVLVGIFIYLQTRVKNYNNWSNHIASSTPDVRCALLNFLPQHGHNTTQGIGLDQLQGTSLNSSHVKVENNHTTNDEKRHSRDKSMTLEEDEQDYHIYESIY